MLHNELKTNQDYRMRPYLKIQMIMGWGVK